ncbi:hypothetical protein HDV00_000440, partial [Rhizophlyctis rosea]
AECLMRVLSRIPTTRQLKYVQFAFRRPDFLGNEDVYVGLPAARSMLEVFATWLEVMREREGGLCGVEREVEDRMVEDGVDLGLREGGGCHGFEEEVGVEMIGAGVMSNKGAYREIEDPTAMDEDTPASTLSPSPSSSLSSSSSSHASITSPSSSSHTSSPPTTTTTRPGITDLRIISHPTLKDFPTDLLQHLSLRLSQTSTLKSLTLQGLHSHPHNTPSTTYPIHTFCAHNPYLTQIRLLTGGCDLSYIARVCKHLRSAHFADVGLLQRDLSEMRGLRHLCLGVGKGGWEGGNGAGSGWFNGSDIYSSSTVPIEDLASRTGLLFRSLPLSTLLTLQTLTLGHTRLIDLLSILDTLLSSPSHPAPSLHSLTLRTSPPLNLQILSRVLRTFSKLQRLDTNIEGHGTWRVGELRESVEVGRGRMRGLWLRVRRGEMNTFVAKAEMRALGFVLPGCRVVVDIYD